MKGVPLMINIKNITKYYNLSKAVDNITLDIPDGKIVGFIGANGAGKSTTIKIITGIVEPDEGTVLLNGHDIKDPKQMIQAKKQFGYVPDEPNMFLRLKGIDYLNFICDIYEVPIGGRKQRIYDLCEEFRITYALDERLANYSHGMRQKINIIAVLLCEPSIWILDEPMVGLDPEAAYILKKKMKEHAEKGNTVFFSTHIIEVAYSLCDELVIISHGHIIFQGTPDQLSMQYPDSTPEDILIKMIQGENE